MIAGSSFPASLLANLVCAFGLALAGCRTSQPPTPPSTSTQLAPSEPPASVTAEQRDSSTATPSVSPAPSATPGPQLDLSAPHSGREYMIPLTIQHLQPGQAVLSFGLREPAKGWMCYWPSEWQARRKCRALALDRTLHAMTITGLAPGKTYSVAVGLLDHDGVYRPPKYARGVWDPVRLHMPAAEEAHVRVGVLGDSGFGEQRTYELAAQLAGEDPDLILHTGDLVYHADQNADAVEAFALKYYLPLAPLLRESPLYPVLGNHEWDAGALWGGRPFFDYLFPSFAGESPAAPREERWMAFSRGPARFLLLDSTALADPVAGAAQTAWLEAQLSDLQGSYALVVFHIPPFTSGLHTHDGALVRQEWVPLFERHGIALVLSGHDHNYERLRRDGLTYVVSGGGSSVLYRMRDRLPESESFAARTHFVLLDLHQDRIELQAVALGGELLDRATISVEGR